MKLIVGLGNPGKSYENTRHNIGFQLLDYIAKNKGLDFSREKFNGKYVEYSINGEKVNDLEFVISKNYTTTNNSNCF